MADMIGPLRVLSTWKTAENARHFRLLEVARDELVGVIILGVLNRAGEAIDHGPDHQWRRRRWRRRLFLREAPHLQVRGAPIMVAAADLVVHEAAVFTCGAMGAGKGYALSW